MSDFVAEIDGNQRFSAPDRPKYAILTVKMRQLDHNERFCVENRALMEQIGGLGCQVAHWVRRTHDAAVCVGNYLLFGDSGRFVRSGERVLLSEPDAFGDHLKTLSIPWGGQSRPPVVITSANGTR